MIALSQQIQLQAQDQPEEQKLLFGRVKGETVNGAVASYCLLPAESGALVSDEAIHCDSAQARVERSQSDAENTTILERKQRLDSLEQLSLPTPSHSAIKYGTSA